MKERLTKKVENGFYELTKGNEIYGEENGIRLVQIVGQYEDIENEYGIDDLKIIFQAIKQDKIYFKFFNEIQEWSPIKIDLRKKNVWFARQSGNTFASRVPISKYGELWALTKEELEK